MTGDAIGTVTQDRGAGIAGVLDTFPSNIPIRISVNDRTSGRSREAFFRSVQDEQIGSILSAVGVYNVIDKTIDRVGAGTAKVSFEITAKDMPGEVFRRENMFYSPTGAAEVAVGELHEVLTLLASNQFHPVDVLDVKVNVEMTQERRTAYISEAKASATTVKPGDTVRVTAKLKPFRSQPITRTVAFTVPKDQPVGPMTLSVRGGGMVPLLQLLMKKDLDDLLRPEKNRQKSFDDLLKDFSLRDHNNDLVVEVMALEEGDLLSEPGAKATTNPTLDTEPKPTPKRDIKKTPKALNVTSPKKKDDSKVKAFLSTDYIVEGDSRVILNVVK